MSDYAYKRRLIQARKCAAKKLSSTGYGVFTFDDGPFSIIAMRLTEIRFVRVVIDRPKPEDFCAGKEVAMPPGCARELWARVGNSDKFEIKAIL